MRKVLFAVLFLVFASSLSAQQILNNEGVIKMVKAGLSEEVVAAAVSSSPGAYDTSADALVALKSAGVGDKIVSAIVAKAAVPAAPAVAAPASGRPAGIDDVGVYYKDKSGAWTELMSEIVNFKTGGVLKGMATGGIVKGDINGHIQGKQAKTSITFPVALAVYVPEGTEITEYQLLRLRQNGNNREFRSVTGGVYHVSGGATRDAVQFESRKIAPRVYQITLDPSLGKGEYGLLPPGSYGSHNMASAGKIYSISIAE
jgi:hypothetical protein